LITSLTRQTWVLAQIT